MNQWLLSKKVDLLAFLLPVWLCWIVFLLLPDELIHQEVPIWVWVVFVIGVDVSHVWSTIFRTYLDREEYRHHKRLLLLTPVICFAIAFVISSVSFSFFWRCLAYLAVYHFIKQQYGFMRIYKAKAKDFGKKIFNDNFIIYFAMLYPVLYWHLNLDRTFHWFMEGDFIQVTLSSEFLVSFNLFGNSLYFLIIGGWFIEELVRKEPMLQGKVLWVLTTAGNWFIGIIYFNSDLVFTVTNVIAHGVPYLALVIFYQTKKRIAINRPGSGIIYGLIVVGVVLFLAVSEEYFWDLFVYRENVDLFASLLFYPEYEFSPGWQHLALAVLAVPQFTHYVLDGFIWKNNEQNPHLKSILLR